MNGPLSCPFYRICDVDILDVNDSVSEPQDSVGEMSTVAFQPTTSTYETVVEHREMQGNASEYEGVVSHALAIQQPVALSRYQYAHVATEAAHGLVYSIVPAQVSLHYWQHPVSTMDNPHAT